MVNFEIFAYCLDTLVLDVGLIMRQRYINSKVVDCEDVDGEDIAGQWGPRTDK